MSNVEKYKEFRTRLKNLTYACNVLAFDEATVCPKLDKENSMNVYNYFAIEADKIATSDEYYNLVKELNNNPSGLDDIEIEMIKKELKELTKQRKIPSDLRELGYEIISKTSLSWEKGKETGDYSEFDKNINEEVEYYKKYIKCLEDKYKGYDVLLDEMEDDFTESMYDEFFNKLEKEIYPLLKKILSMPKKYNENIKNVKFDIDKQRKLTKRICEMMGYDDTNGYIGETLHPFTNGFNSNDVRTTTSYSEELLFLNIYSVMHEVGHAIYELQVDKRFDGTVFQGGASCAIHESQSRFFENYLGRSKAFIHYFYPILLEFFPNELKDYTEDDIYYYVNDVYAQLTRTEADELTYPFHVLIRYNIEKKLFSGKLNTDGISDEFDCQMEKYLGIKPKNKKEGCYQDIHWASGFGYFPTYALGSAMSAQFYYSMKKDIDIDACMEKGDFKTIREWLGSHVHKYGASKKNLEIVKLATNEEFNPDYYIKYLKEKFTLIYGVEE